MKGQATRNARQQARTGSGLTGLLITILIALKPTLISAQIMVIAIVVALGTVALAWLLTWFVPGEAIRERRGWRLF